MPRFFIDSNLINENEITIQGEDVKHIINVLRMKKGEEAVLCDGKGIDYYCTLEHFDKTFVKAVIKRKEINNAESPVSISIFQGIAKGDKMDLIIQKAVELGVSEIIPIVTDRTVVKLNGKNDSELKQQRWQRIALEAAKQCGRGKVPKVYLPISIDEAFKNAKKFEMVLMAYEKERKTTLKKIIENKSPKTVAIYIGPEGGFSDEEASQALLHELNCVTLGNRILRTETCGLVLMSILMYEMGDVGA